MSDETEVVRGGKGLDRFAGRAVWRVVYPSGAVAVFFSEERAREQAARFGSGGKVQIAVWQDIPDTDEEFE